VPVKREATLGEVFVFAVTACSKVIPSAAKRSSPGLVRRSYP
jgi:hypothetical protein